MTLSDKLNMGSIIDVHAHAFVSPWRAAFGKATGHRTGPLMLAGRPLPDWTVEGHLRAMDENAIGASVLSLPGATAFLKGGEAKSLARAINESLADTISRYPSRFGAFAVLPLDDIDAAVDEMRYALDVLKLDGVSCDTHVGGMYLGNSYFDMWFEEMNRRETVLFVHPIAPPGGQSGGDGLNVAILEFMFESTRTVVNMVMSGTKRRFPNLKIISTHGGGTIPYLASRVSILAPLIGAEAGASTLTPKEILTDIGSFYFDLTASTSAASLDAILRLVPVSRLLMGFDFPMMPTTTIAPALQRLGEYDMEASNKLSILSANAKKLFPRLAAAIGRISPR